jgi:soluble lytic murein transglycosylase-like protein
MKQVQSGKPMDFERWAELAISDPEQFEEMRRAAIDEFLQSVSSERRLQLQRLQWRVDRVRERCTTPMAATIAISEMMWESFYDLHDRYQDLFGSKSATRYKAQGGSVQSAKILPFEAPETTN